MKTKKSKRLLAAFLAAIMVLTTFAAMPFSSYAATYSASDLKTLLDQYESRVEGTTVYTNLVNSYDAWIAAYRVYVGVTAGITDAEQVDTAYTNLQTQMNAMQVWTPRTGSATRAADNSYTRDSLVAGDEMTNVLYTYGVSSGSDNWHSASDYVMLQINIENGTEYGSAVLLYDGISTPAFPVNMGYTKDGRTPIPNDEYTVSMSPTTANFELRKDWHGYSTSGGYQTNNDTLLSYRPNTSTSSSLPGYNADNTKFFSNTLYWTGDSSSFGSNYSLSSTVDWIAYNSYNNRSTSYTHNETIYVINYKALIDAVQTYASNICDHGYAQVRNFFTAMETAMSVNPQALITGSDLATEVSNCAASISSAITQINTMRNRLTTTVDMASYVSLAQHYAAYTPVYAGNNSNGYYEADSYLTFTQAYNTATQTLKGVIGNTAFSNATTADTNLVNGYNGLKQAASYVDDSELQALFATYYALTPSYYVTETYENATAAINNALQYYNDNNYTSGIILTDTEENQAIYDEVLAQVQAAIAAIEVSHDATVGVGGVQVSYNTAMAYISGLDGSLYSNYNEVLDKAAAAEDLMEALDAHDFTNETAIIGEYTNVISALVTAIGSLELAFTNIENGTVVSQSVMSTNGYNSDNLRSFLNNQIVNITYFKTTAGTQSFATDYNITFNNHWEFAGNRGVQLHSLGFGAIGANSITSDNDSMSVRWNEGGAAIQNPSDAYASYHDLLMKPISAVSAGNDYVNIPADSDGNIIMGETTVTVADEGIRAVSFTTPDIHEYIVVNEGTTGWEDVWQERTNTDVKQTVTVIDVSSLFTLVNESTALRDASQNNRYNCYTADSYANFLSALQAAMANMSYTTMTNEEIVAEAQSRYDALLTAKNNLDINEEGTHSYVKQDDSVAPTCTVPGKSHYICSVCGDDINVTEDALGHDYIYTSNNDNTTHTTTCSKDDYSATVDNCIDEDNNLSCDLCGQQLEEPANFEQFDAAKAELEALLAAALGDSVKFTSAALMQANEDIAAITFYNYDASQQLGVGISRQGEVDEQTAAITAASAALRNGETDDSAYQAFLLKMDSLNADACDIASVNAAVEDVVFTATVPVNGVNYTGYDYDNYNITLGNALGTYSYEYTVTVYDFANAPWYLVKEDNGFSYTQDEAQATAFTYGDYVTAPNPNTANASEEVAWSFKSQPVSKTDAAYADMDPHYETTATEYSFNVLGDTEVFTSATAEDSENNAKITFIQSLDGYETGKVLYVHYAEIGSKVSNLSTIPQYLPFYTRGTMRDKETGANVVGFTNARGYTVTGDMTVVVDYVMYDFSDYEVTFIGVDGATLSTTHYSYNDYVQLSDEGAVAYVNAANNKVLCYGSEYGFYACQDITVKAVDEITQEASVDVITEPIRDGQGQKIYLVGSFALPEGATIKSFGFVMDGANANHEGLSLADLDPSNYIINLYAYDYTCEGQNGNQFEISFDAGTAPVARGTYVAYAVYTDASGNEQVAYSDVITNAAIQ